MRDILLEALTDSAAMLPFLFLIYFLVEWFERRFGETIEHRLQKAAKAGPALGAVFGSVPQCGFSVVASALYARRLITKGALLAVFLATSDEAVPVMLAQPDKGKLVVALIFTKLLIGLAGGYAVDLLLGSYRRRRAEEGTAPAGDLHERGCCKHELSGPVGRWQWLTHPLVHTAKVFVFVLAVSFAVGWLVSLVGEENLGKTLLRESPLQPFLAALVGLIPNCAASVAIAQIFLKGGLSWGSALAGLCSSGGLGILVLLKENSDRRDTVGILLLLVGISTLVGIVVQAVYG